MPKPKYEKYSDYVIRDGRLVGEFEQMYRDFSDPWHQMTRERFASEKAVMLNLLDRLQQRFGVRKVVEVGSGLGNLTERIAALGLKVVGLDVSETAVSKARGRYSHIPFEVARFDDFERLRALAPDAIVMAEVTWYVLNDLREFIAFIERELPHTFLLHSLMTYPPGTQQYGREFFTDLEGILDFFGMRVLESGEVRLAVGGRRTYFLGCWSADVERQWLADD